MGRLRNLSLFLLLSSSFTLAGCQPRVTSPAPASSHENVRIESAKKALAEAPTYLSSAYKQDSEQKTWQSALMVTAILVNCVANQQLLKERGVEFNPVTSKKEAMGWAELALRRTSQSAKSEVPGARDPVESVQTMIDGIRRMPD